MPTPETSKSVLHPPVAWAQRKDIIILTIEVEDCKTPVLNVEADKLSFQGKGGAEHNNYEAIINFHGEVDPESVKKLVSDRHIQVVVTKKEVGPFWPRLTKDKTKVHWIKVDFDKWKDEDDEEEEGGPNNFDLNSMMGQMGGMGGGFDERPDLGDFEDSDNEDLPDLEEDVKEDGEKPSTSGVEEKEGEEKKAAAAGDAPPVVSTTA